MSAVLDTIDWARMAEPQDDQYDTRVTLALATTGGSPLRPEPYVRRSSAGLPTIPGTDVALRYLDQRELAPPRFALAPPDHPNLPKALAYLRRWPAAYEQFLALIDSVHACVDPTIPPEMRVLASGSCSHSHEQWFGTICVTVDDPIGCAQAFVHEMAHQKLRALGVSVESAWRLVTNDPGELFPSPIRIGVARPMTAVLHAQYSFIYIVELDLRMLAEERDPAIRERMLQLLMRNVVRMEAGHDTLARNVRTDDAGARFLDAFLAWSLRAIEAGYDTLDRNGYETRIGGHAA
ncbi:MAG TPA: HEXXH motif-containing putative peptide modification protein [Thermoanaerobaculia bacterium]|nr:HEXXH motif-containing putative peptide modification protein [Thermoanaerobaculia bacterium]